MPSVNSNQSDNSDKTTVVYNGPSPCVQGAGYHFGRGEPVEVPTKLAVTLGSGFSHQPKPQPNAAPAKKKNEGT